jgi:hypothetical protein
MTSIIFRRNPRHNRHWDHDLNRLQDAHVPGLDPAHPEIPEGWPEHFEEDDEEEDDEYE